MAHDLQGRHHGRPLPLPSLTGLRGVAALWVLLFHAGILVATPLLRWPGLDKLPVIKHGWVGVDLFFILSGFILAHVHRDDFGRVTRPALVRFAKVRFARVYPLNAAVLGLIVAVAWLDEPYWSKLQQWSTDGRPWEAFLRTVTLGTQWLPGAGSWNEPTWSLSAEIAGYALFPFVLAASLRLKGFWSSVAIAVAALASLIGYLLLNGNMVNPMGRWDTLMRMACCLVAGVALSQARRAAPRRVVALAVPLSLLAVALIVAGAASFRWAIYLPVPLALLIFSLSFGAGPVDRVCRSRPALFLGKISFSLYLVHTQLLMLCGLHVVPLVPNRTWGMIVLLATGGVVIGLSWLLFELVEQPSHRFGRRWANGADAANRLAVEDPSVRPALPGG